MSNNLIQKNAELGRFLFCERYTLQPVKNALYIAEGQDLKRGAVVDVNGVLVGINSLMPYAVLENDCDTRAKGAFASVFVKGEFNIDKLFFADGLSKNDLDNIVYNGSGIGIVIKPYDYAKDFAPLMVPEGTSEENPLMNAEDVERMINAMKPIDAMTLRFDFSKKDYNPETAGVGSAGTWTKVDSPTLNIWDWTNENTNWKDSFKKAFLNENNEVRVIAAGDTSSVTNMRSMFEGDVTGNGNPSTSNYVVNAKNNLVSCVPLKIDSCTDISKFFEATHLKKFVQFDYSNNKNADCILMYTATDIEEIGDIVISGHIVGNYFSHNDKLKKVGNILFDSPNYDTSKGFNIFSNSLAFMAFNILEEVGNITGTSVVTDFSTLFQNCVSLKKVGSIDVSGGSVFQAMFSRCQSLEEIPNLIGIGDATITNIYFMFRECSKIKELPYFDTSSVTNGQGAFTGCSEVKEIPNYDFSSITNAGSMFSDDFKVSKNIVESYEKLLARGSAITNHSDCFKNCGVDTPEGRAARALIPKSWGGDA